jgi:uncharacterized membrane protein
MDIPNYQKTALANVPPGWSYNPSERSKRHPTTVAAVVGLLVALYLGSYQLHLISQVWDPFFGSASSERILTSTIAKKLPIPDALLGAVAYFLDILGSSSGPDSRWKTQPWLVILFGMLVGLMGIGSLFLLIAQPVFFKAWCTLCLASAAISISIVGLVLSEVWATCQYLQRVKQSRLSVWEAFCGK